MLGRTPLFIYSALGMIAFILLTWRLPETRGRSLEQLEVESARGRSA